MQIKRFIPLLGVANYLRVCMGFGLRFLFIVLVLFMAIGTPRPVYAQSLPTFGSGIPGYTVVQYTTLPAQPSAVAIDIGTRTLYLADYGNQPGLLRKVVPGTSPTVATVTSDFSPSSCDTTGCFYPYVATDIDYSAGNVYVILSDGSLVAINVTTGTSTVVHRFTNFGNETGIATNGSLIYATDGGGSANQLRQYNLATGADTPIVSGLPSLAYGVEYDRSNNRLFFSTAPSGTQLYLVTATGSTQLVTASTFGSDRFAVDPNGLYLYVKLISC